jgi:hypothetical protein
VKGSELPYVGSYSHLSSDLICAGSLVGGWQAFPVQK